MKMNSLNFLLCVFINLFLNGNMLVSCQLNRIFPTDSSVTKVGINNNQGESAGKLTTESDRPTGNLTSRGRSNITKEIANYTEKTNMTDMCNGIRGSSLGPSRKPNRTCLSSPITYSCPQYPCFMDDMELAVAAVGMLLNFSTTIALARLGRTLKPRLRFLLSLSITNFWISVLHIVRYFYQFRTIFLKRAPTGEAPLTFNISMIFGDFYLLLQYVAVMNILVIAIDVLIILKWPLYRSRIITKSTALYLTLSAWCFSAMLYVSTIVAVYTIGDNRELVYNVYDYISIACCTALVIVYVLLVFKIKVLRQKSSKSKVKSTFTIVAILLAYTIFVMAGFWITMAKVLFRNILGFRPENWLIFVKTCQLLYAFNSVADPIIYVFRTKEVWGSFRNMFNNLQDFYNSKTQQVTLK